MVTERVGVNVAALMEEGNDVKSMDVAKDP